MKGGRENTTLMLVGGLKSIVGQSSVEFTCGHDFGAPDHTTVYGRLEGGLIAAFTAVNYSPTPCVIMKYFTIGSCVVT